MLRLRRGRKTAGCHAGLVRHLRLEIDAVNALAMSALAKRGVEEAVSCDIP